MTDKAVLVTGTSSGIGHATAIALDKAGFKVYATVRHAADAEKLKQAASNRLTPVILDITNEQQVAAVVAQLTQDLGQHGLYGLVNNAGIPDFTPIEALPIERLRRVFEVNVFAMVRLTQALLPLIRQAPGRIINIGSVGAHTTIPFGFALCASKHAVESFTTGLRIELAPWNIDVIGVDPSSIRTKASEGMVELAEKIVAALSAAHKKYYADALLAMAKSMHKAEMDGIPATGVAQVIVKAMTAKKPKTHYSVGPHARQIILFSKILPDRWFDKLKLKLVGIKLKGK